MALTFIFLATVIHRRVFESGILDGLGGVLLRFLSFPISFLSHRFLSFHMTISH